MCKIKGTEYLIYRKLRESLKKSYLMNGDHGKPIEKF